MITAQVAIIARASVRVTNRFFEQFVAAYGTLRIILLNANRRKDEVFEGATATIVRTHFANCVKTVVCTFKMVRHD
jgi:hypothetical protein